MKSAKLAEKEITGDVSFTKESFLSNFQNLEHSLNPKFCNN